MYRITAGRYPTTEEGFAALVNKPANAKRWMKLLAAIPLDPWKKPYRYVGKENSYTIFSTGRDGVVSGDDIYEE